MEEKDGGDTHTHKVDMERLNEKVEKHMEKSICKAEKEMNKSNP